MLFFSYVRFDGIFTLRVKFLNILNLIGSVMPSRFFLSLSLYRCVSFCRCVFSLHFHFLFCAFFVVVYFSFYWQFICNNHYTLHCRCGKRGGHIQNHVGFVSGKRFCLAKASRCHSQAFVVLLCFLACDTFSFYAFLIRLDSVLKIGDLFLHFFHDNNNILVMYALSMTMIFPSFFFYFTYSHIRIQVRYYRVTGRWVVRCHPKIKFIH